jgi:hypothetical protein
MVSKESGKLLNLNLNLSSARALRPLLARPRPACAPSRAASCWSSSRRTQHSPSARRAFSQREGLQPGPPRGSAPILRASDTEADCTRSREPAGARARAPRAARAEALTLAVQGSWRPRSSRRRRLRSPRSPRSARTSAPRCAQSSEPSSATLRLQEAALGAAAGTRACRSRCVAGAFRDVDRLCNRCWPRELVLEEQTRSLQAGFFVFFACDTGRNTRAVLCEEREGAVVPQASAIARALRAGARTRRSRAANFASRRRARRARASRCWTRRARDVFLQAFIKNGITKMSFWYFGI